MKMPVKIFCAVAVIIGAAITYAWPWIKMDFAENARYTELDKREYEFYTPDLLKKMPRISPDYVFDYSNISGPQALIFSVTFYGTDDTSKIRNYLSSAGYKQQTTCDVEAECWRAAGSKDIVSVAKITSSQMVLVQIDRNPYTQ